MQPFAYKFALCGRKLIINHKSEEIMKNITVKKQNTFVVKKPFGWMEPGDTFELSNDGMYECTRTETFSNISDSEDSTAKSTSTLSASKNYISMLEKMGVVENADDVEERESFKNIFDEIDNMLETYNEDLSNIETDMANAPACMKIEKETVLRNLIKTLSYLKSLKR